MLINFIFKNKKVSIPIKRGDDILRTIDKLKKYDKIDILRIKGINIEYEAGENPSQMAERILSVILQASNFSKKALKIF